MRDIILLVGVAVMFVFGWFVMKRLDAFLVSNAQAIQEEARSRESVLRIAVSDPAMIGEVSHTLEPLRETHPDIEVRLYTADAGEFTEQTVGDLQRHTGNMKQKTL